MTIRTLRSSRAFTLIELLIVITIIGILAVALLPKITAGPGKARDTQRKTDLDQIATALALYADDSGGTYPAAGTNSCVSDIKSTISAYLTSVPADPKDSKSGACTTGYTYLPTSNGFILSAGLETSTTFGDNIYDAASVTTTNITSAATTATGLSKLTACETAACTGGLPAYVVPR